MAGKVGHLKIFGLNFTFVFRHRFEKEDENSLWDRMVEWREWELGFWFRRFETVGKKNFKKPEEWKNNMVYMYMLGINLLWCKAWFTVEKGAMTLNIDKK